MSTNNSQVAHLWANQARDASGSHFYSEGRTIFSYGPHFPIATFTDARDSDGRRIVLFTTRGYSNTTSKHKSLARGALHGLPLRVIGVWDASDFGPTHESNARTMAAEYAETLGKAARARSHAGWHLSRASQIAQDHAAYCTAFGLDFEPLDTAENQEEARAAAERERERARQHKEAKRAEWERDADAWRRGAAPSSIMGSCLFPTLLRVVGDTIETSRGAQVPRSVASVLWTMIERRRAGEDLPGIVGTRIGDFDLREVRWDGSLVIGCHTLEYAELERMANTLGFIEEIA